MAQVLTRDRLETVWGALSQQGRILKRLISGRVAGAEPPVGHVRFGSQNWEILAGGWGGQRGRLGELGPRASEDETRGPVIRCSLPATNNELLGLPLNRQGRSLESRLCRVARPDTPSLHPRPDQGQGTCFSHHTALGRRLVKFALSIRTEQHGTISRHILSCSVNTCDFPMDGSEQCSDTPPWAGLTSVTLGRGVFQARGCSQLRHLPGHK